ncbi:hypothetical protein [Streptomyces sp. KL116D]|uniref:hypothetical protein n=1 Tax=Streptomyces sp. KL116D TaxID=3045152 RepID=UPI003558DE06
MGYASYTITRNGEEIAAGYAVEATCEQDGCEEQIDRGLAYLCGAEPGGDEYGCGGYFCGGHLYIGVGPAQGMCDSCSAAWEKAHPDPDEVTHPA